MCEINPKHTKILRLECFTSHPITKEEFEKETGELLLEAEMMLNKSGKFRSHIHEVELE